MDIAKRLRELREVMRLSQGDISERTGLAIAYISRVEHSRTTPTIQVLERWSAALGIPIAHLFAGLPAPGVDGNAPTGVRLSKEERRFLALLKLIDAPDRRLLFSVASKMAKADAKR